MTDQVPPVAVDQVSPVAVDEWKRWHERRVEAVSGPYGPPALVGTLPQCLNGLGAPPGWKTIRRGDFRTSPGAGPCGTAGSWSPPAPGTG